MDCLPARELLDHYAHAARSGPPALLCGPVAYLPPPPPGGYDPDRLSDHPFHAARPAPPPGALVTGGDHRLFWSLSFAIPAAGWVRVGGFCPDYAGYGGEDTDFALLAQRAGLGLTWVGGAAAYHQWHPDGSPAAHQADILRNGALFAERWGWWPMGGWLDELAALGLARRTPNGGWSRDRSGAGLGRTGGPSPVRIALLAHCHHPIAEPFCGGLEMHTAAVADELVRRGHQVVLFAKEGSRSRALVRPILERTFRYGLMPDATGRDQSERLCVRANLAAVEMINRGRFDVVLNNTLSPVPFQALSEAAMLTLLHTPADLPRINAVLDAVDWRPGPGTRTRQCRSTRRGTGGAGYRPWPSCPTGSTCAIGDRPGGRSPSPTWPSGRLGSPRRRASRSPSRPAGRPGCGWPSPVRSATSTTSSPRWRRCWAATSGTWAISTTASCPG